MRLALLLATSSLLWSPLLMSLAEAVDVRAETFGHVLGSLQRVQSEEPSWILPDDSEHVVEESLEADDAAEATSDGIAAIESSSRNARAGSTRRPRARQPSGAAVSASKLPTPKRGLRVRTPRVLQLAKARATPDGNYIPAAAGHPGGMQLSGVGHFGVGLRDGDVLSHVQGVPATSRGAVVSAVMQARAAKAPAVSAIFWRDGEPWRLLVEMPYLSKRTQGGTNPQPTQGAAESQREVKSAQVAARGPLAPGPGKAVQPQHATN